MGKQANIPILRFPEFDKNWNEDKLGEIATFSKGKGISKADIAENGITECIRYGELYTTYGETINNVVSRTNVNRKNLFFSEANDVIIPASGETQLDIATASCVLRSGIALGGDLNIIKTVSNGVFLSYYLNTKKKIEIAKLAQGISVVHLYSSQLSLLNLFIPEPKEQTKIASFFSVIDKKIQALKNKKELLEEYKKGVAQKLFSQEIRFKPAYDKSSAGRDENGKEFPNWKNRKLGELTNKTGKKNRENISYPVYSINNKEGFLPQSDQFDGMDSNNRGYDISMYKIIKKHTFAYNPARINVGSIGYSEGLEDIIISSLYVCFQTTEELEDDFFLQYLKTFDFNKSVLRNTEGGVRSYLFYENFSRIEIPLPYEKDEQTKIADFLSTIDKKIDLIEKQLNDTEQWKKGLLQKMFC